MKEVKKSTKTGTKKKSTKRKSTLKKHSDLRTGYNEGAEESKNWLADSQNTYDNEATSTVTTASASINPQTIEVI